LSGGQAGAFAGYYTALSADGNVVAVGATLYDYTNNNVGRVQVFEYSGNSWILKGGPDDLSGGQAYALAGYSTALSADGNVVAVGAKGYHYTNTNNNNAGRVQVFDYSGNSWILKGGPDDLSGGQAGAAAGNSTALSADGNVVAVGATAYDYTNTNNYNAGRVQVFDYSGNSWILKGGPDDLSGGKADAQAGFSTALSADGNVVAVGARHYHYTNNNNAGRVQVFHYMDGSWILKGGPDDLSGGQANAFAGNSTALSADGNVVAVGATGYDYTNTNTINAGRVQVFDYMDGSWVQRGSDLSGGQAYALAGYSTALSADGNVVAVGAKGYHYTNTNNNNAGRVQVFEYSGNSWILKGGPDDLSGGKADAQAGNSTALSADGNVVAVGAYGYDYTNNNGAGRVQVFHYMDGSWILKGGPDDLSGGQANAQAGYSTALSADGNVVAVGATGYDYTNTNNYNAGRVQVFDYSGNSWVQRGSDLSGGQAHAFAGNSTALSADGNVVAVGATGYGYDYTINNNDNAGRVQVFDYMDGSWVKRGSDDLSGGQAYAQGGISTALSADGNVVAVGATAYDYTNNNNAGRVQVFDYFYKINLSDIIDSIITGDSI
jgi:hypothetical protein